MAANPKPVDPVSMFNRAEQLLQYGHDKEAFDLYFELRDAGRMAPLAYYRMGQILNRRQQVDESLDCHRTAFELDNLLARSITENDHPCYDYRYGFVEQTCVSNCPICGEEGRRHSCYNAITNPQFTRGFDPIRLWMYCDSCHHIFAANYPTDLAAVLRSTVHDSHLCPNPAIFPALGSILRNIKQLAPGNRFLEIGVGAGEMAAVAKEFLFDVTGIDIRPAYAEAVSKMLDVPIYATDFRDFESDRPFDVICLGDVIEHTTEPVRMLLKIVGLLSPNGVLWLSTPNFESASSRVLKYNDPLWLACEHLNYFCYRSLRSILQSMGMTVVDYAVSAHCAGAMEITAVKRAAS